MHMAPPLDVPTVAIFGPTDPRYSGPHNNRSLVVKKDLPCSPCYLREDCVHRRCLEELDAASVIESCRKVLEP